MRGATWNPLVGCSVVSPGCTNCYAMRQAGTRLASIAKYRGLTLGRNAGPVWTGEVRLWEPALDQPLRWKEPRRIFVNSMSDLFHENVPDEWIDRIFAVMALCPQHQFQILTKRPGRMRDYCKSLGRHHTEDRVSLALKEMANRGEIPSDTACWYTLGESGWHFKNIWLGTSVEDQRRADERIPLLLDTPAAVHWISAEPLLGPVDLDNLRDGAYDAITGCGDRERLDVWEPSPSLDWVVVGSESGPSARPCDIDWVRGIRNQCSSAGVAFFWKQAATPRGRKISLPELDGRQWLEYPAQARR